MAGFQLAVESESLSADEIMDIAARSDDYYEFDDVSPMFLWAMHCIDDAKMEHFYRGMPGFSAAHYSAVTPYMADEDLPDPEDCWRAPAAVAEGLRLLAQSCRMRHPGAEMIWAQASEVFDPIETTDGGRRIANEDGSWDNAAGDWAGVCADELEGFARLIDFLATRDDEQVRLVIFTQ